MKELDDYNYMLVTRFWNIITVILVATAILAMPFVLVSETVIPLMIVILSAVGIAYCQAMRGKAEFERKSGNAPRLPWKRYK